MTNKSKNILFLVTGMTPAIITETIWALACDPNLEEDNIWIPDEVHVLSTEDGLTQIRSKLLNDNVFQKFKKNYPQIAGINFGEQFMHSIKDANNNPLSDLKTPQDNEYAANEINEHIRKITQNENVSLHVSIAGGRKTMGFYAGYSLSLYGRAQDSMSHVLVDERFEYIQDFFYPTSNEHFVTDRNNKSWDASKAKVWLANIPFVRMKDAIKDRHQLKTDSFIDTVRKINESYKDIQLSIDIKNKKIIINDKIEVLDLPPKEFAFLCLFADDRIKENIGIVAPRHNTNQAEISTGEFKYILELSKKFISFYRKLRDEMYFEEREDKEEFIELGKNYFEGAKTGLKKQLELKLGLELAAKLEITNNKQAGKPFYLNIAPEAIKFV